MTESIEADGRNISYAVIAAGDIPSIGAAWRAQLAEASGNETFRSYVEDMAFEPPESIRDSAAVVLVAALETPPRVVSLFHRGKERKVIQPPQYYRLNVTRTRAKEALEAATGAVLEETRSLPAKYLAARSGLGKYGRNNVINVAPMGTAITLLTFWATTGKNLRPSPAVEAAAMESCASCRACAAACPSGAIPRGEGASFVIDAGKCLALYNEEPGVIPDWFPKNCHDSTMGCSACQLACPENRPYRDGAEPGPSFAERETALLLSGNDDAETREALSRFLSLDDPEILAAYLPTTARNLKLFLEAGT